MVNGINIKEELKTPKTTTPVPAAPVVASPAVAVASGFDLLVQAGFEEDTARQLAGRQKVGRLHALMHIRGPHDRTRRPHKGRRDVSRTR